MRTAYDTGDAVTLLRVEHAVSRVLAAVIDLGSFYHDVLSAVAGTLGWEVAAAWELDPDDATQLRRTAFWHAPDVPEAPLAEIRARADMPIGRGLPGRVWMSSKPTWIVDVTADPDF